MKATKQQQAEAIAELRELLHPGDTVYVMQRSVSRSGMQRTVKVLIVQPATAEHHDYEQGNRLIPARPARIRNITRLVAHALQYDLRHLDPEWLIRLNGAGMDMHFHLVYSLSVALFRDTEHDPDGRDAGYLLDKETL